jgi:hypothetical protein
MARPTGIEEHPDIVALRARYDLAGARPGAQLVDGLVMLSGLYLAVSPWIVGFGTSQRLTINNLVTGIVVGLLALGFSSAYGHTYGISWCVPVIGVWTIIATWVIYGWDIDTSRMLWSNVIVGGIITILGLATMGMAMITSRGAGRRAYAAPTR